MPAELGWFGFGWVLLFFIIWPDPPCTRSAVAGRTVQAEAGLWVVLMFVAVVSCGGVWLGVAGSVGCATVW